MSDMDFCWIFTYCIFYNEKFWSDQYKMQFTIFCLLLLSSCITGNSPSNSEQSNDLVTTTGESTTIDDSEAMPTPTFIDIQILNRANEILSDASKWNRHDTRHCKPSDTSWSLFCALHQASVDITGTYEHRRAALQETRKAVERATSGQEFEHRLRDYNNLETTTFADIKQILASTISKVSREIEYPNGDH